ncbi:MAG: hypothetical protein SOZ95_01665 [Bacilli bacterium]|nr:hypothetical protein [Bacilli bacterium]
MKKIVIIFIVILLSLSGMFGIYKFYNSKKIDNKTTENIIKKNDEKKIEKNKASETKDDNQEVKDSPKNEEEQNENNENNKTESKTESNETENNNQVVQSNTKREEQSKQNVTKSETPKVEQPKVEKKPWEELGISENDYYNKPMWNWMTVEFDVNTYGSQSAAESACRDSGNKKAEAEGLGFSCTNVLSYSGKYLGEHIKFF